MKETVVFTLFDREYFISGDKIISDLEANAIFERLLKENRNNSQPASLKQSSWKDDETNLLQWAVFQYALQKKKYVEDFIQEDWVNIGEFIPTKDHHKCLKRWMFI